MLPDRHLIVPPGRVVRTGYVDVFRCVLANRARMAVGDVDRAFQKCLQLGENSMWPCPNGHWDGETFVVADGRHEYVASVMLGKTHILVAWLEAADGVAR